MAPSALKLRIRGLVHGVFFRATMAQVASGAGVRGYVRNLADGSVEAFLEGEEKNLNQVLEWAKHGPPRARVDSVKVEKASPQNLRGFKIEG